MSSELAIEALNISKEYLIYRRPPDRLMQALAPRAVKALNALGGHSPIPQFFTRHKALSDVSIVVPRGSGVGIVGRNGSGKSTLLQIICRTLTPSSGTISVTGRVAALLELGSGFNPEFTGRENIYLNASVLGMQRSEIDARYADIVAFADIGEFVEQPVKTYSTGMAMRLAFAVIAHIEADVLIIDEALAVGDAYFQQKCMRWLRQFSKRGTLLFCGHDTGAVLSLCQTAVWLDKGTVLAVGPAKEVVEAYSASIVSQVQGLPHHVPLRAIQAPPTTSPSCDTTAPANDASVLPVELTAPANDGSVQPFRLPAPPKAENLALFDNLADSMAFGSGKAEILEVGMTHESGAPIRFLRGGEDLMVTVRIRANDELDMLIVGFHVKDRLGQPLFGDNTFLTYCDSPVTVPPGHVICARFRFNLPNLASGRYSMTVACASGTLDHHVQHHWIHDAMMFDVHSPFRNGVMIAIDTRMDIDFDPSAQLTKESGHA